MNTVAIIQARMGSSRLPGKSLMMIQDKPLIWHVLNRVKQAKTINSVWLAIPQEGKEVSRHLAAVANHLSILTVVYNGSPNDLIGRYAETARVSNADLIVRVPGDNPCVDPDEIDRIVGQWHGEYNWLLSNLDQDIHGNGYPGGLGAEVYNRPLLNWLDHNVHFPLLREHPHLWAYAQEKIRTVTCPAEIYAPEKRFDVNTSDDLVKIQSLYRRLPKNFRSRDLVKL